MSGVARLPAFAAALLALHAPAVAEERVTIEGGGYEAFDLDYAATGAEPAGALVRGCPGFAAAEPALAVTLSSPGDLFLRVGGAGAALMERPDGIVACETVDAYGLVRLDRRGGAPGEYRLWPLAAEPGASVTGRILATGYEPDLRETVRILGVAVDPALLPPLLSDLPPDPFAPPVSGEATLAPGGEITMAVALRGLVPAEEAGPGCAGLIDQTRPDARLTLSEPLPRLVLGAESDMADSTLMIIGPDGALHCGDDQVGYNPFVVIEPAEAGAYAVWAGVYPGGEGQPARLVFGETIPEGAAIPLPAESLATDAAPAWGYVGRDPAAPTEVALTIAARVFASDFDPECSGAIEPSRPDLVVSVWEPGPMTLAARSDGADATLLVITPSGVLLCNDDHDGTNPAVGLEIAETGDYFVWVGAFGGGEGAEAVLTVTPAPIDGAMDGTGAPEPNPFAGRDVPSAAAALAILEESPDFSTFLTYERMEETGPEGFILHGVTLSDPTGVDAPVSIARIAVSDLDLAGLSAGGGPERFALTVEGIDYAALAAAAEGGGPSLPLFETPPPLSVSVSLLPPGGDETRRDFSLGLVFEGQFGLGLSARLLWPEGAGAMDPETLAELAQGEAVELRIDDMGFIGASLARAAAEMGRDPGEMVAETLAELEGALGAMGPFSPGSPRGMLLAALTERLTGLDRPGRLRLRLSAPEGVDAETAFGALMEDAPDPAVISVEIAHEPL
ncbi:MAG: hypothetical protein ACE37J_02990 [Pikeienuella sp.]|uniref:hypothetical protein n=1 Tax=Pikeienuella sp. TaxID=2831957 RepID=UPI00391881E9